MPFPAGQTALVTGGGRGIGEAIARLFAKNGARVFITARSRPELERVASETGAGFDTCDVTVPEQVESVVRRAGRVDVLVNNAGMADSAPIAKMDLAFWRRIMDTNATSAFLFCRAVVPGMIERKYGRIVNIASIAGKRGSAYISAYAASKHAMLGLTTSLAAELAPQGIKVNAVCPGYVETPMTKGNVERLAKLTGKPPDEIRKAMLGTAGQPRMLEADEVAAVALRLAVPECAISGAAIDV